MGHAREERINFRELQIFPELFDFKTKKSSIVLFRTSENES
jgi:hypothetical protein